MHNLRFSWHQSCSQPKLLFLPLKVASVRPWAPNGAGNPFWLWIFFFGNVTSKTCVLVEIGERQAPQISLSLAQHTDMLCFWMPLRDGRVYLANAEHTNIFRKTPKRNHTLQDPNSASILLCRFPTANRSSRGSEIGVLALGNVRLAKVDANTGRIKNPTEKQITFGRKSMFSSEHLYLPAWKGNPQNAFHSLMNFFFNHKVLVAKK